jgi:hypothetical protein
MGKNPAGSASSYFSPFNDEDESVLRTCAQLLIYPGRLHPSAVTRMLGVTPTRTVAIGERINPSSERLGRVNGWFLSSEDFVESKDLRRHLDWLIALVSPARSALFELQVIDDVRMYVKCPWWSGTGGGCPHFWPQQLRGLADLNLECTLDFADYSERDDDQGGDGGE